MMRYSGLQPWIVSDILDTDYTTYSIHYSCQNLLGILTIDHVWILMKHPWEVGSAQWNRVALKAKEKIKQSLGAEYISD